MGAPVLVFDRVSKSYPLYHPVLGGIQNFLFHLPGALRALARPSRRVVDDLSFVVRGGETFGIIGRNGSGKSTALGMVAGVLSPTRGRVWVGERVSPLLELGGGFHPDLSGVENVVLNGVLLGLGRREVFKKLKDIVAFSGLAAVMDQPLRTYSSGMLARLGFSVIAHTDPRLLLVDEILSVGDLDFQKKCFLRLMEFKAMGVTTVFVSHSLGDVKRICDRVLWMEEGRANRLGPAAEVVEAYEKSDPRPVA